MTIAPSAALQAALKQLANGESLSAEQAGGAFNAVMAGDGTAAQLGALLMGLRVKGETPDELAGAARALRRAMTALSTSRPAELVDTCGTGGGAMTTFNISTAAAILAAGAGVRVAKHGNRSFTTKSGSADVLEALGVAIDVPVDHMGTVLDSAGIVFMFAPTMHPAMRHVGPARREMAIETLMNLVGPLANPAGAGRQVIGVASMKRIEIIAGALALLGTTHSLVVHGEPGDGRNLADRADDGDRDSRRQDHTLDAGSSRLRVCRDEGRRVGWWRAVRECGADRARAGRDCAAGRGSRCSIECGGCDLCERTGAELPSGG